MNHFEKQSLFLLTSLLFLLICFISQANELVNLSLHDEVYAFVKRIIAKNLMVKRLDNTQPLTRRDIAEALIEISEKYKLREIKLTDVEKKHLEKYLRLFGNEIEAIKPGFYLSAKKKNIFTVKGEDYRIDFDLKSKQEAAYIKAGSNAGKNKSITSLDFSFFVKLGEHLGISSILHDRMLYGKADYNPYRAERAEKLLGKSEAINAMEGYIILSSPRASIQWGVDGSWWGPGWHGALMISDNSAPKDNLRVIGRYGPVKFTYFTAILREKTLEYQPKYMSAHRVEFLPHRRISIGLSEVMVFADRYEPRYLNPFISFYMVQTENYKNNGLLGLDFDATLLPSVVLYGELMVDDLQPSAGMDIFRAWNSKYGILLGGYWVDPFGLEDTDLRLEYAFINQYAYTHRYDITRYTHQDFIIGHWIGTDADDLWLDIKHWLTDKLRASLTYEMERQGEGDVRKPHPLEPLPGKPVPKDAPEYWEFLSGVVELTHSISVGLSCASIGRYSAGAEYTYSRIKNAHHNFGANEKEHKLVIKAGYHF